MATTCERCGAVAPEGARYCASCGAPLGLPPGAERKLATLVFCDLVGSTELASRLDPEELRRLLARYFEVVRETLTEHGGTVEKYVGDAVMAAFGVPRAYGDDPDRAIAASLALIDRVAALGDGFTVRVGVETGEVLTTGTDGDLAVTGEAVNAAARLQQAAAGGEVLVGGRAARAARRARIEPREPVDAKGFSVPLAAWRAVGTGRDGAQPVTAFVGREDDLELLRLVYRRAARARLPELVTITGEAGVGKTRLIQELFAVLRSEEPAPRVLSGSNPPYGRGIAFWALGEVIRDAAGCRPDEPVSAVRSALARRLRELGADNAEHLAATFGAALGATEAPGDAEDELKRAWRLLIALLAAERPLVIAIDDAHWADEGLLDLIEEAAFRLDDTPLVLICTSRPELLERRPGFGRGARNVTQLELRPIPAPAMAELAETLLDADRRDMAATVAEISGGNPFFAEEVARRLAEDPEAGTGLPETVQGAIAARLDLLPPREKRAIQHAAVLGDRFRAPALADLVGEPIDDAVESLSRKALLRERLAEAEGRYSFRHQLIREVAYGSLPRAERARLHERAAEGLARRAPGRAAELAELIAFHRIQAAELDPNPGRRRRAVAATLEAAEALFRRGASQRSQHLYEQAAELTSDREVRIEAVAAAAAVALRRFRGDEAVRLLRAMAAVAEEAGDETSAASAYAFAVETATRMSGITGMVPESELREMLGRGKALAAAADPATRALLVLDEGWIAWARDDDEGMVGPAREGLALARQAGDPVVLSSALDAVSASAWTAGRFHEAVEHVRERLVVLERQAPDEPRLEIERSDTLHMMVESLIQVGAYRDARDYATQARELDLDRGVVYSGWARAMLPSFYLGDWDEVLTMGKRVREAWTAMERPPSAFMAGAIASAGAVLGYRGDERAFGDWMSFASEMTGALRGERGTQAIGIVTLRADVALHRGELSEAVQIVTSEPAASVFWWRPSYLATRAEALVRAGESDAAAAVQEGEAGAGDNPHAQAIAARARGLLEDDEGLLRDAMATFERIECPYQTARTGWFLGGEDRRRAEATFAELGATLPG
jgi:class 3 adenylate cyclase/tetratricopeptide (TPR) repeat protein